jgi:hypothetical protein
MPESSTRSRLREANAIVETATKELAQAETLAKKAVKELETAKAAFQNSVRSRMTFYSGASPL